MSAFAARRVMPPLRGATGLFGGSFNPPHQGHRHVSLVALRHLRLDALWWLVSPGNPLKDPAHMAPLERRLKAAVRLENHPRIFVTDIERALGTRYTADTLAAITGLRPQQSFVWIMGADNLATIHLWKDWEEIFQRVPVAVIARPGAGFAALSSPAARRFASARVSPERAFDLTRHAAPAWTYLDDRLDPTSSTALRAAGLWP